jgi:hypothetical protein
MATNAASPQYSDLPPGAVSLPNQPTPPTQSTQPQYSDLPAGAVSLPDQQAPAAPATGALRFVNQIGEGAAEGARDIWGVAKNMIPGGAAETGALKTVWNNLPPVQLTDAIKQVLPVLHVYEQKRASGASISDSIKATDDLAKQHQSNILSLKPAVDAVRENPTRETVRALADASAAALALFGPGEVAGAIAPEAEAAATAAKVAPAAEAEAVGSPSWLAKWNPFRGTKAIGTETAQPGAQAAVRTAAGAEETAPIMKGNTTVLDEPLQDLHPQLKAAYKQVDDTVGFDLKAEKDQLKDDLYEVKQPSNIDKREAIQQRIDDSTANIAAAEAKLTKAGIDPRAADALNKSFEAGQQFKQAVVRSTTPDGTVNVSQLLNQSKVLRFTKRGDRLAQFLGKGDVEAGKPIADAYMKTLQEAQTAGVKAMQANRIAKWAAGLIVSGGAAGTTLAGLSRLFGE